MSNVYIRDPILQHYGVLGMKWGVRKDKQPASKDHTRAREFEKKGPVHLSNDELSTLNKRLKLEQTYAQAKIDKSAYKRGVNFVRAITAGGSAIASLYALSKTPLAQDAKKAFEISMAARNKVTPDFSI